VAPARGRGAGDAPASLQRSHRPHDLGPRIEFRGANATADLRPWGGRRYTVLRSPKHPRWPAQGMPTQDADIAREWSWAYVRLAQDERRRHLLGTREKGRKLGEALDAWVTHRQASVSANTASSSVSVSSHLLSHFGAGVDTDALLLRLENHGGRGNPVQPLFDELLAAGYSVDTLVTYRNGMSAFCAWLGHGEMNAARQVSLPDPGERDVVPPTLDEMEALRHAADQVDRNRRGRLPSARWAVETGLATGARRMELFALEKELVNPAKETIRFRRQLVKDGSGFAPLKGKLARTAFVLPFWWEHWERWKGTGAGLLVANADGSVIGGRSRVQIQLVQDVLNVAGLNAAGRGWHWLRHGYARLYLEEFGGTLDELRLFMGHSSVIITERAYGWLSEQAATSRAAARARARLNPEREKLRVVR
jgi:integrase